MCVAGFDAEKDEESFADGGNLLTCDDVCEAARKMMKEISK